VSKRRAVGVKLFYFLGTGRPREIVDHVFRTGRHVLGIAGEGKPSPGGQMCRIGAEDRFVGTELHESREREGLGQKIDGGVRGQDFRSVGL